MKQTFQKRFKRLITGLIILFISLFIFRLLYGYSKKLDESSNQAHFFEEISNSSRNYATKKYEIKPGASNQSAIKVDQKYEKIAAIKTKSTDFEKEEKTSRETIKKLDALIQFEQKSGNKGDRNLNLVIGVPPDNFDTLYNQLIKIGKIKAKQITKKDKTNEYKELNAKKQSLEKIRSSLIELKSKRGRIDEYMGLENRILEIEQQLQGLGVSLGDFDDENEFCTVQFSLVESKDIKIGLMQRLKVALEWTLKIYLKMMASLFFLTLFAYFILLGLEKIKIFERIVNRKE